MYEEFLTALLTYVQAMNKATNSIDEKAGLTPYLQFLPVILEGDLAGFLVDEVGGSYQYVEATAEERSWWASRPKAS